MLNLNIFNLMDSWRILRYSFFSFFVVFFLVILFFVVSFLCLEASVWGLRKEIIIF